MDYKYDTPESAVISLETAFCNEDLDAVLSSKDFFTEARIILRQANYQYDVNDKELLDETAEVLKLSLVKYIRENGLPDFNHVKRNFSEFKEVEPGIFSITEALEYPNGDSFANTIYLSKTGIEWKVVMVG